MDIDYVIRRVHRGEEVEVVQTKVVDQRGKLAQDLLARWGILAASEEREDSAGRQQLRLLTPEELVTHACEVAELAWATFAERGWLLSLPPPISNRKEDV